MPLVPEIATARPPAGAGPESVKPNVRPGQVDAAVESCPCQGPIGITWNDADVLVTPAADPEIVRLIGCETDPVVIVKGALDAPSGTVTDAGMVTAFAVLVSETVRPPVGAGPLRST